MSIRLPLVVGSAGLPQQLQSADVLNTRLPPANVFWYGAVGDGITDDTAAIQAAHNASPAVYYPTPSVRYNVTSITLPIGASIIGESGGDPSGSGGNPTIVYATTSAFAYTFDVAVLGEQVGPRFLDIVIQAQNGVRLNSSTAGQPGQVGCTQGVIHHPSFRNVSIFQNGTPGTGFGIQASVCAHLEITEQCEVENFDVNVDLYFSDIPNISHNRITGFGTAAIRLTAANTWGSQALICHNDLLSGLTGSTAFIVSNYYHLSIVNNYMEQTAGEGTGLTAAIVIDDETLQFNINDNDISMPLTCAPNWLKVTNTSNLALVRITGNKLGINTTLNGPAVFNAGVGLQVWAAAGNVPVVCTHVGNTFEDGIPFNSIAKIIPKESDVLCEMIPGLTGAIIASNYGASASILNDQLVIPFHAVSGNSVTWIPIDYAITGLLDIWVLAHASGIGTVSASWADNGAGGASVGLNLTTTPTWYNIAVAASVATKLNVITNGMTASYSTYIHSIVIYRSTFATAAQFADKTSTINTINKYAGKQAWSSDGQRPVWAAAEADTSVWKDGVNSTVYTPV